MQINKILFNSSLRIKPDLVRFHQNKTNAWKQTLKSRIFDSTTNYYHTEINEVPFK